jgi:hypothetical protein
MAGRYKVDVIRGNQEPRRRSSHKTLEDAVLQSKRSIKKEPEGDIVYTVSLDGVILETINREHD